MEAQRDQNRVAVLLLRDPNGATQPAMIEHVTGYVLAQITNTAETVPAAASNEAKRDPNRTKSFVARDPGGGTQAVIVESSTNNLWGTLS